MKKRRLVLLIGAAWLFDPGSALRAQDREVVILERTNSALDEIEGTPLGRLPVNRLVMGQLRKAQGVAIFPGVSKVAAGIGRRRGDGVLLLRATDGSWGPPVFLELSGASAGFQVGVSKADLMLIFRTRGDVERLLNRTVIYDVDGVMAVGPFGVGGVFGADVGLKTCVLSPASPTRGFYLGRSVERNRLRIDAAATAAYERDHLRNGDPTATGNPSPLLRLQMRLARSSAAPPTPHAGAPLGTNMDEALGR